MNGKARQLPVLMAMTFASMACALIIGQTGIAGEQPAEPKAGPTVGIVNVKALIDQGNAPGLKALLQQHRASLTARRFKTPRPRQFSIGLCNSGWPMGPGVP